MSSSAIPANHLSSHNLGQTSHISSNSGHNPSHFGQSSQSGAHSARTNRKLSEFSKELVDNASLSVDQHGAIDNSDIVNHINHGSVDDNANSSSTSILSTKVPYSQSTRSRSTPNLLHGSVQSRSTISISNQLESPQFKESHLTDQSQSKIGQSTTSSLVQSESLSLDQSSTQYKNKVVLQTEGGLDGISPFQGSNFISTN